MRGGVRAAFADVPFVSRVWQVKMLNLPTGKMNNEMQNEIYLKGIGDDEEEKRILHGVSAHDGLVARERVPRESRAP